MSGGFSLINIDGKFTEPATVLIKKISDALSGYFRPHQIRRVAEAEAEASIIETQAQIERTKLQRRALIRFVSEEATKQNNIETIIQKAIPQLTDSSTPQDIEDDWITNFFDKCRIISDDEMQLLWAKILSSEANSPGAFSRRTVNSLGSLDKSDAQLFIKLCSFVLLLDNEPSPFVYDTQASIYNDQQINYSSLAHLDDIGLVSFNSLSGYRFLELPKQIIISYFGTTLTLELKNAEDNELVFGEARLTNIGKELSRICGAVPIDGFLDYLIERWSKEGIILPSPYPKNQIQ